MSNLIIIGNGFDLQCGLKTKYQDFIGYRKKELQDNNVDISLLCSDSVNKTNSEIFEWLKRIVDLKISEINVWDFIFMHYDKLVQNGEINWFDIEQIINTVVNSHYVYDANVSVQKITGYINKIEISKSRITIKFESTISGLAQKLAVFIYLKYYRKSFSSINVETMFAIMLKELNLFESNFLNYVKTMRDNVTYYSSAHNLLEYLNGTIQKYSLLNFNFTDPTLKYAKSKMKELLLCKENVHGSLSNNKIIFGIDHTDIPVESSSYQFSKTARKIYNIDTRGDIDKALLLDPSVNKIVLYGHSLNLADYAYFQSIFDFYDLYGSEIILSFFFSIYDNEQKEIIERENFDKVINLVSKYGNSISDNPAHGKNLIHKLLLENRLRISIIERNFTPKRKSLTNRR